MRPRWFLAACVALAVVAVALLGVGLWIGGEDDEPVDRSAAARTSGREAAELFFTLDPEGVETTIDELVARSTGAFKTEYAGTKAKLVEQVRSKGITTEVEVLADGVGSGGVRNCATGGSAAPAGAPTPASSLGVGLQPPPGRAAPEPVDV